MWYRAISLRYACIRSSDIILIPYASFVPNFISFMASVAQLAHAGRSHTQTIHSPSLFDVEGTEALILFVSFFWTQCTHIFLLCTHAQYLGHVLSYSVNQCFFCKRIFSGTHILIFDWRPNTNQRILINHAHVNNDVIRW